VKSVRPLNLNPWKIELSSRIILDGFWNVAWFGKKMIYKFSKTQKEMKSTKNHNNKMWVPSLQYNQENPL
jgi:hypothetical protein